jgi:hypothetical protein
MKIKFELKANLLRQIKGPLKTSVSMNRMIASMNLPVKCYLINGVYVGSCQYDDLCTFVRALATKPEVKYVLTSLFKSFFDFDDDTLRCPIESKLDPVNISQDIDLPDFSKTALSVFMSGDYKVNVEINDSIGSVGCWTFFYTIKP